MTRKKGYYWVRRIHGEWEPGEWCMERWWLFGVGGSYTEGEISEVGERIVKK